jgi:MFS family permease
VTVHGAAASTSVPARLDRLPWSRFHWRVVAALGITWVLDGLEVTLAGSVAPALQESPLLHLSDLEVGAAGSAYVAGAVLGALVFGQLADRLGRKRLFSVTLGVYLVSALLTALSWDFWSYAVFRALTGAGIGGEYSAINSAIQELIPARFRGRTDLAINGSFWVGAAAGAAGSLLLLDPAVLPPELGWRLAFGIGAALALGILYLRRYLPESPRWLMIHGCIPEAEAVVDGIEAEVARESGRDLGRVPPGISLRAGGPTSLIEVARVLLRLYPRRTLLGLILMAAQAFCYNAIFFTYALILTRFQGVAGADVGLYILPFAVGNFLGPLLLGHLFDTLGRRAMIGGTYLVAGALLFAVGALFAAGWLTASTQTLGWTIVFFFASAAASSAYLTVGESFPLEIRALAIAVFYAFGTLAGGVGGPWLFGLLIESGSRLAIFAGYALGAVLMGIAGIAEFILGINAERRPLEEVAAPLSSLAPSDGV